MLFNSFQFLVFFLIVYGLYLILPHKWQNRLLLIASYIFYGAWDWRFLSLICLSTALDYIFGLKIYQAENPRARKFWITLSIVCNLSVLGFFKYFNFFAASLQSLLQLFGVAFSWHAWTIILPVGISFYTFQSMSYTIDIYRKEIEPVRRFSDFMLFVSFFPQLVAGPIERAKHLLPQILHPRILTLERFYAGCYLIFWGLFEKVFVADNLAKTVDSVFNATAPYPGMMVLLSVYAFAFQIYCDFDGYSNIARGLAKLMGFDLMLNFRWPYFATNPQGFWSRWHISLSSWMRDYIYIPLGGNRKGHLITYRNLAITMLLAGLWHGAAWTFVAWGTYHGFLLILHRILKPWFDKRSLSDSLPIRNLWFCLKVIFFFHLVGFGWLIFRARSMTQISQMLGSLWTGFRIIPDITTGPFVQEIVFFIFPVLAVQIFQYVKNDFFVVWRWPTFSRALVYFVFFYLMVIYGASGGKEFIYFQF